MLRALALAATIAAWGITASAHPGGHGPMDEYGIRVTASNVAAYLVKNDVGKEWGTLPESWSLIHMDEVEILAEVDGYYVVAVRNREESQTLYVLVSDTGDAIDVNFTGTFPYVYDVQKAPAARN